MQGALRTVIWKRIPDREADGASLRLAVLQRISTSELKASYDDSCNCASGVDPRVLRSCAVGPSV
jgi:hypothetical protein